MKTVLLTDLDDTLFSTPRKQPIDADFISASTLKDGSNSGWQSPVQQAFWALWQDKDTLVIPVTARNHEAFSRVRLPFSAAAVINHGGVILDAKGEPDPDWHARQRQHSAESLPWLQEQQQILATLADELNMDIRMKINRDHDLNLYVLLKSNQDDDAAVARLAKRYGDEYSDLEQGYIHCNSNNLAILPHWLGKASAVDYLKQKLSQQYGQLLTLGCGDSLSDLGFMQCCDFYIAPQTSQISEHFIAPK